VDRILAAAGDRVITWSEALEEAMYHAFLDDQEPPVWSPQDPAAAPEWRSTVSRMADQALLEREQTLVPFSFDDDAEVQRRLDEIRRRFPDGAAYGTALARYGLTEEKLRRRLAREVRLLQFVDYSLRPQAQISGERVETYYNQTFLPQWRQQQEAREAPPLSDVRERIVEILVQQEINRRFDDWLQELRRRAKIQTWP
jgi:hypothetical protein